MRWILFRERDQQGNLIRESSKESARKNTAVSYESMFKQVKRYQSEHLRGTIVDGRLFKGWTEADIERLWQDKLDREPSLRRWTSVARGR